MEEKIVSQNGVPVFCEFNQHLHSVKLGLYIKCGAMYETAENNGITHFFEHVIFRNINKLMGMKLYKLLDRNAVEFNAVTYKEFMNLYFVFSMESLDFVLEIFRHIFEEICLTPKEIETERNIIKSEIYEEDDKSSLGYSAEQEIWKKTTLTQTVLGTPTILNKITKRKLNIFRKWLFSSGDMFVYLTGNTNLKAAQSVADILSNSDITESAAIRLNTAPIPEGFADRRPSVTVKSGDCPRLQLCFDFFREEASSSELNILYDLLFRGDSCLFYSELTEKRGLIYSYTPILEEYCNIGNLRVGFDVKYQNIDEILSETVKIFNKVKTANIDIESCKAIYKRNCEQLLDDADNLNWDRAYYGHIADPECSTEERIRLYLSTDKARVSQIAQKIFTTERLTVAVKGKKTKISTEKIRQIMSGLK